MPVYECHTVRRDGKSSIEKVEGRSPYEVTVRLREQGLHVCSVIALEPPPRPPRSATPLTHQEVLAFNDVLVAVTRSGALLPAAIVATAKELRNARLQNALNRFSEALERGQRIDAALQGAEPGLPPLYINMLRAGEAGGNLPAVLDHYGNYARRMAALRRRVISAVTYPVVSGMLILMLFVFLCVSIAPVLRDLHAEFDARTPLITLAMYGFGQVLRSPVVLGLMLCGVAAAGVLAFGRDRLVSADLRFTLARLREIILHHTPLLARCQALFATAQFSQTMASLLSHGVSVSDAFPLAADVSGSPALRARKAAAHARVVQGEDFITVLESTGVFASSVLWLLKAGWNSGDAVQAFSDAGEIAERDFDTLTADAAAYIAPVALLLLGLLVLSAMLGILIPFISLPNMLM